MNFHPQALVDPGAMVGARTRVWAFAHVCDGAVIGEDCNLCDHTFLENGVQVGNRVTVKCGVYLWDGAAVHSRLVIDDTLTLIGKNCISETTVFVNGATAPFL